VVAVTAIGRIFAARSPNSDILERVIGGFQFGAFNRGISSRHGDDVSQQYCGRVHSQYDGRPAREMEPMSA